ncbi:MAG: hypothetical protein JO142_12915 [Burkholderiales bacterium]|nr:hypothetical protein [Burkholderiales bacterium]
MANIVPAMVPQAVQRAMELRQRGKAAEAITQYRAVVTAVPDQGIHNLNLGTLLMSAGQVEEALPYLRKALVDEHELLPHLTYTWALLGLGRAVEAKQFTSRTIARFGADVPVLNMLHSRAQFLCSRANAQGIATVSKVFCIGHNKTGTTSVEVALKTAGYRIGDQATGEQLIGEWAKGRFEQIIALCHSADAFQDIPFALKHTYRVLDEQFPGSKFVLTVRSSSDEWFNSISQFHKKIIGKGRIPTADDLKTHVHLEQGWLWRMQQSVYGIDEDTVYSPNLYKQYYESHNAEIIDHFKDRPDDLLILNLAEPDAMSKLCGFLGFSACGTHMPHENRT